MSLKGLEPSQINLLEPKPSASTNSATSTRWSKRDISHKDITETYPLSYHGILVYLSSASGNTPGRICTHDQRFRRAMLYLLSYRGKRPPGLCFYERHRRGETYTRFGPLLLMRQSYHMRIWLSSGKWWIWTTDLCVISTLLYRWANLPRWAGRDLNPRRQSQRIYSPPPLTTRTPTRLVYCISP